MSQLVPCEDCVAIEVTISRIMVDDEGDLKVL